MKREKCELRLFFRPAVICGNRGAADAFLSFFSAADATHVGRLSVFLWHDGEWTDRDRNPTIFR